MDARTVLIDTSLFIAHIRARDKTSTLLTRIHERRFTFATSSIVVAELSYGARTGAMRAEITTLLSFTRIIPFTEKMAFRLSWEAERLKAKNAMIGFRDLAIACSALEERLPVATLNRRDFERVEGLNLVDPAVDAR
ncbi:MAG: type II toxin-antitoxin system VapC family toxin [Phycisphaerales bacterium]|nr:type II toxin-antitoxin system VapC family toxin [Phycisphaerales bacterium]